MPVYCPPSSTMAYKRRMKKYYRGRRYRRKFYRRKKDGFKRANRSMNKFSNKLMKKSKFTIQRPMSPNVIYRRFTQFTQIERTMTQFAAGNGTINSDYEVAAVIPLQDLNYYKARYFFGQLVSFTVTFMIESVVGLTQAINTTTNLTTFVQSDALDPKNHPDMYIAHWNSSTEQNAFAAISLNSVDGLDRLLNNKSIGRLNQTNKVIRKYRLPQAYRGVWSLLSGVLPTTLLDQAFAGPIDNEPHGITWHWPAYLNFPQVAACKVRLQIRVDSVIGFKSRQPDAV